MSQATYWFTTCPTKQYITSSTVRSVDIAIIGGGIAGVTLLYQLVRSGHQNVCLIEESTIGFRASGRSSGQVMLRGAKLFSQLSPLDGIEYLSFVHENNKGFLNGIRIASFDTDLQESGGLRLALDDKEMEVLNKESLFILKNRNIDCPMLDKKEVNAILPGTKFIGGMFVPNEATFNPYKVVNGIREIVEGRDMKVFTNCQVENVVRVADNNFSVVIRHKGTIKAKKIVYCTNAYTPELVPELKNIMTPFRGQMVATDLLPLNKLPPLSMSCNNEYWRVHDGKLLAGGMRHSVRGSQVGILNDGEISTTVYENIKGFITSNLPMLDSPKFTHVWTGIMCATPDEMPLIGPLPKRPNEFVFGGFNGYGFSHALHGSFIMKDFVINGECHRPGTRLFDPKRFANAS